MDNQNLTKLDADLAEAFHQHLTDNNLPTQKDGDTYRSKFVRALWPTFYAGFMKRHNHPDYAQQVVYVEVPAATEPVTATLESTIEKSQAIIDPIPHLFSVTR
jgi:hypothetical protein